MDPNMLSHERRQCMKRGHACEIYTRTLRVLDHHGALDVCPSCFEGMDSGIYIVEAPTSAPVMGPVFAPKGATMRAYINECIILAYGRADESAQNTPWQ